MALKRWRARRSKQLEDALEGRLLVWDRVFVYAAESFEEWQRLRDARLTEAAAWIMTKRIQPDG